METRSLVLKNLQSSVRPEVLKELMDTGEGVSELPSIMNRAQVSPLVPLCTYKCPGKRDQEAGSSCTVERKPTPVIPTGVEEPRIGV